MSYGNRDNHAYVEAKKNTEAGAVAAIVDDHCHAHLHQFDKIGVPAIVLPKTGEVKTLENLLASPSRARAKVNVRDQKSFLEYVKAHRGKGTFVVATITEEGGSFTAIIDYHVPISPLVDELATANAPRAVAALAENSVPAASTPQWGDHVCVYLCEFTPEWDRWIEHSGKMITQPQMAQFIEDNLMDIKTPVGAEMLEIVKTLEATQGASFKGRIRLDNGDHQFNYAVETGAKAGEKGQLEIPKGFTLSFPIFTNGLGYDIECRFRYNLNGGQLLLGYEIIKPHKLIAAALQAAQDEISKALQMPVLLGDASVTKA